MPKEPNKPSSKPSPDKLHGFIANLPGMACQIQVKADGAIVFPYVSEGCVALFGITPQELQDNPSLFLNLIHPDDVAAFHSTLQQSAQTMCFWSWEGRVLLPQDKVKWISLGATPQQDKNAMLRWEGIMLNITQSKLGELEIKRAQQQLLEFSSHIQDAKEQERLRIAREVHDEIGSLLTAIKIDLAWLTQRLPKNNRALADKAKTIEELVNKTSTAASNLAHSLRPGFLDCFGLVAAIEIEAQEFSKRSGIQCIVNKSDDSIELPDTHSITLYRIFQESLNNIMKHAHASQVTVDINNREDGVELTVSDNGRGLSDADRLKPRSFGLRGIHERVAHFNGEVNISSAPGQGTTVAVFIPYASADPATDTKLPQQTLF
jgi:signal transduction histidine kinase